MRCHDLGGTRLHQLTSAATVARIFPRSASRSPVVCPLSNAAHLGGHFVEELGEGIGVAEGVAYSPWEPRLSRLSATSCSAPIDAARAVMTSSVAIWTRSRRTQPATPSLKADRDLIECAAD